MSKSRENFNTEPRLGQTGKSTGEPPEESQQRRGYRQGESRRGSPETENTGGGPHRSSEETPMKTAQDRTALTQLPGVRSVPGTPQQASACHRQNKYERHAGPHSLCRTKSGWQWDCRPQGSPLANAWVITAEARALHLGQRPRGTEDGAGGSHELGEQQDPEVGSPGATGWASRWGTCRCSRMSAA